MNQASFLHRMRMSLRYRLMTTMLACPEFIQKLFDAGLQQITDEKQRRFDL